MLHDLRYWLRALVKRPSFAAGTIVILAFAVGVNTAVFSLVNALVPLPDVDAATFVAVPVILAAVLLAAGYLPARRAARVDPLVVLRSQ